MKILPAVLSLFALTTLVQADVIVWSGTGKASGGNANGSLPTLNGKISIVTDAATYETRVVVGTKIGPIKKVATTDIAKVGATQVKKGSKVSTVLTSGLSSFVSKTDFEHLFAKFVGVTSSLVIRKDTEGLSLPKSLSGSVNLVNETDVAMTTAIVKFNSVISLDMNSRNLTLDQAVQEIQDSYK